MIKSRFLPCWFKLSIQAWFTWLLAYDEVQICTRSHPGTYQFDNSLSTWISWTIPLGDQRWKQAHHSRERPTHLQPSVKYTDTINKTKAVLNDRVMSSGGQLQLQLRTPRTAPLTRQWSSFMSAEGAAATWAHQHALGKGQTLGVAKPKAGEQRSGRAHAALVCRKFSRAAFAASITDLWKRQGTIRETASSWLLFLQLERDFSALGPTN